MAEQNAGDGLPSLNLKGPEQQQESEDKAAGTLLARMPKVTPSAAPKAGLLGRFRGMAKKDMGLMVASGAMMVMLPLAENFMMKSGDKPGASGKPGELFEPNGTVSYGNPGMGDSVTPLTARDPLSLILAGGDEEPKAAAAAPDDSAGSGGGSRRSDGFRESVREPFQRAVERARSAVPSPKSLSFRGSSFGGGGGSSPSSIVSAARNAPSAPASKSMAGAHGMGMRFGRGVGGYAGVEKLHAQGDNLASMMNRGSAVQAIAGMGGEFGGAEPNVSRPASEPDNQQQQESEDKYKLQPPKPKKPAEPKSGGGGLQPWFKEMKEMEAKGEIDREKARAEFAHKEKMEMQKWLRDNLKMAMDTALINPLKEYMAAAINKKFANPQPDYAPPAPEDGTIQAGEVGKNEYASDYEKAQQAIDKCKSANPGNQGPIPEACLQARDALDKAADKLGAVVGDYTNAHTDLAQKYQDLQQQIDKGKQDFTSSEPARLGDLNGALSTLQSLAPQTAKLESRCKGNTVSGCNIYRQLNPKEQERTAQALIDYNTAMGAMYGNSEKLLKSMDGVKQMTQDNLYDGNATVQQVKNRLTSEMSGRLPDDYLAKLEEHSQTLGDPKNPAQKSGYDWVKRASATPTAGDDEDTYWKTVEPQEWLKKAAADLAKPAPAAPAPLPPAYKDDNSTRPPSMPRFKTMVNNAQGLPQALERVAKQLDSQTSAVKANVGNIDNLYKTSQELAPLLK